MKQLDPKSEWIFFFYYTIIIWAFTGGIAAGVFPLLFISEEGSFDIIRSFILPLIIVETITLFASIILGVVMARYAYKFYKYELRDDGFRKELGVILKKYVTIPYDRIQNVNISRGILDRLLGLSTLQIFTAGTGAVMISEGMLPGLSPTVAENVRDELIHRARQSKNQGL